MTADVLDMVAADVDAAEKRRQDTRARFPDFARIMDSLGADARMRCIRDEAGNVLAGKLPPADPSSWVTLSGEFVEAGCRMGHKEARR
jgi:hypothetical protein